MFIGREEQLSLLANAYFEARGGAARLVLLAGEAGLGKSRLVREFAKRMETPLLAGHCVPVAGAGIPFAPIADVVRAICRDENLAQLLEQHATRALLDFVGGDGRDGRAHLDAGAIFEAVLALLGSLTVEHPLLLLIEDIHWADSSTWELLAFLSRALTDERVVVVATLRGDEVASDNEVRRLIAELLRSDRVQRIDLVPLTSADVTAQVVAITDGAVDAETLDAIVRRSAGNPLFAQELAAQGAPQDALPPALDDLLASRISDLPPETRRALRALGVIGRQAADGLVAAALNWTDEVLEEAIRPSVDARVVTVVAEDAAYAFTHPLFAEAALNGAMPSELRRLHGRVADALATRPQLSVTPVGLHSERAAHLLAAQRLTEALYEYLSAAAINMRAAPGVAYRQFERALDIWGRLGDGEGPDRTRYVDILWDAAEMAEIAGAVERAIELAQTALASSDGPPSSLRLERLSRYLWAAGRVDESNAAYERAAAALESESPNLQTAQTLMGLGQAYYLEARYSEAGEMCRRALSIAEDLGSAAEPIAIHAARVLAAVESQFGRDAEALDLARSSHRRAVAIDDPERHLAAIYVVEVLANAGRDDEAVTVALDAMADAQRAGLYRTYGMYLAAMAAESMIHLGRWPEARSLLRQQPSVEDAVPVTGLRLRLAQGWLASRSGDHATASELLEACDIPADRYHRLWVVTRSAEAALNRGDWNSAAEIAAEGAALAPPDDAFFQARMGWLSTTAGVEALLDRLARREDVDLARERDALRARLEDVRRMVEGAASEHTMAFVQLADAEIARLGTAPNPTVWAEAAHTWTRLQRPWPAARARLHQAEDAISSGDYAEAQTAARTAYVLASTLGAPPLAEAVEQFAARSRLRLDAAPATPMHEDKAAELGLTSRENEVLSLVSRGYSNREIGEQLYVSAKTVSVHVSNILRKLGVTTRIEAAAVAQRLAV